MKKQEKVKDYIIKNCPCLDDDKITCQRTENYGIEHCIDVNSCFIKKIYQKYNIKEFKIKTLNK